MQIGEICLHLIVEVKQTRETYYTNKAYTVTPKSTMTKAAYRQGRHITLKTLNRYFEAYNDGEGCLSMLLTRQQNHAVFVPDSTMLLPNA